MEKVAVDWEFLIALHRGTMEPVAWMEARGLQVQAATLMCTHLIHRALHCHSVVKLV